MGKTSCLMANNFQNAAEVADQKAKEAWNDNDEGLATIKERY